MTFDECLRDSGYFLSAREEDIAREFWNGRSRALPSPAEIQETLDSYDQSIALPHYLAHQLGCWFEKTKAK